MREAPLRTTCGGASRALRIVFRALPCRVPAATWCSGNLEWTAAWLRIGAEDLNGRVSLLGAQALPAMLTLGPKCWLRFDVWPTGKCVPVWRQIVGYSFHLGAVWETVDRNFALLWVALSATSLKRKASPRIYARNGTEFPPLIQLPAKGLPSRCSGGLSFNRKRMC